MTCPRCREQGVATELDELQIHEVEMLSGTYREWSCPNGHVLASRYIAWATAERWEFIVPDYPPADWV